MSIYEFLLTFAKEHWFLATILLCMTWGLSAGLLSLSGRFHRTIMVLFRWPLPRLAADVDRRPKYRTTADQTDKICVVPIKHEKSTARLDI